MGKRLGAFEKRIHEIDLIRGIMILIVIMDHLFWFLKTNNLQWYNATGIEFFNGAYQVFNFYWRSASRQIIRQIVLFLFTFISGVSCAFSRNNWKRAGQMLLVYAVLTLVTNIIDAALGSDAQSFVIDFNIIGVLAWSVLIYCFFQNRSWKGLTAVMLIFLLFTITVIPSLLNIPGATEAHVPALWKPTRYSDWQPLFPYICYFFAGAIIAKFIYKDRQSLVKRYEWERPFCFVGRHTIWIYLGHEPLLYGLFFLLTLIFGAM